MGRGGCEAARQGSLQQQPRELTRGSQDGFVQTLPGLVFLGPSRRLTSPRDTGRRHRPWFGPSEE